MKNLIGKKKNMGQLIFHKQCIYEISKSEHKCFQRYEESQKHDIQSDKTSRKHAYIMLTPLNPTFI